MKVDPGSPPNSSTPKRKRSSSRHGVKQGCKPRKIARFIPVKSRETLFRRSMTRKVMQSWHSIWQIVTLKMPLMSVCSGLDRPDTSKGMKSAERLERSNSSKTRESNNIKTKIATKSLSWRPSLVIQSSEPTKVVKVCTLPVISFVKNSANTWCKSRLSKSQWKSETISSNWMIIRVNYLNRLSKTNIEPSKILQL